jgi:hypothetical protein
MIVVHNTGVQTEKFFYIINIDILVADIVVIIKCHKRTHIYQIRLSCSVKRSLSQLQYKRSEATVNYFSLHSYYVLKVLSLLGRIMFAFYTCKLLK